jgi:hypothetical protein
MIITFSITVCTDDPETGAVYFFSERKIVLTLLRSLEELISITGQPMSIMTAIEYLTPGKAK